MERQDPSRGSSSNRPGRVQRIHRGRGRLSLSWSLAHLRPRKQRAKTLEERSEAPAQPGCNRKPCSFCPNSRSNLRFPARPRWLLCCTCTHRSCRAFVPAMNCSLNPLACRFHPTPLCPLPTISIPLAIAALDSWRPLDTLGFPARTSSRPNHFPISNTQARSRCPLRTFLQRFCGFSCRAAIARSTSSALLPTVSSGPPRPDGNGR
jgi:hypothetical protein